MDINSKKKLNNGVEIPLLGFGVYQTPPGNVTKPAVLSALEVGYRHIDTAAVYGNEKEVGNAVKESGINRKNFYYNKTLERRSQRSI